MGNERDGIEYTAAEIRRINLAIKNKETAEDLSVELGRSVDALQSKARTLGKTLFRDEASKAYWRDRRVGRNSTNTAALNSAKNLTPRACLNCARTFQSEGKHNRLCSNCRGKSVYA